MKRVGLRAKRNSLVEHLPRTSEQTGVQGIRVVQHVPSAGLAGLVGLVLMEQLEDVRGGEEDIVEEDDRTLDERTRQSQMRSS